MCESIFGLCSVDFYISLFFFFTIVHCLDYCSFIVSLEMKQLEVSNLALLKNCLGYSRLFAHPYVLELSCQFL